MRRTGKDLGSLTLSPREAAAALGVGQGAVYQAIRDGRLPALRIGRKPKLRIPKMAIEELLRNPARWERDSTPGTNSR